VHRTLRQRLALGLGAGIIVVLFYGVFTAISAPLFPDDWSEALPPGLGVGACVAASFASLPPPRLRSPQLLAIAVLTGLVAGALSLLLGLVVYDESSEALDLGLAVGVAGTTGTFVSLLLLRTRFFERRFVQSR
jgi:hypothetical protein